MKLIVLFSILLSIFKVQACTTFVLQDSTDLVFGRNLDWVSNDGLAVINKRNIHKSALVFPPEKPVVWTSKYGSVTFNQFGKEFPFGGMNEKGLVVELMLVGGSYPDADDREALNELQWVQYQLDNCATIQEVLDTDKKIRISKINQKLHFLICDAVGNKAVIEFNKKGMIAYYGKYLIIPVLENDTYAGSLTKRSKNISCRFSTAADMISAYKRTSNKTAIAYSFEILDQVALDQSWSIVYDIKNMLIHFKTTANKKIRKIDVSKFQFDCTEKSLLYDLKDKNEGLINSLFMPYDKAFNDMKFKSGLKSNAIWLPGFVEGMFLGYNESCVCKD
jgi:penicillin V acylase-like amidase (Ntn superfamily)